MSKITRSVADRRRGLRRVTSRSWLRWLCNPLVLKMITALAQAFCELLQLLCKHR